MVYTTIRLTVEKHRWQDDVSTYDKCNKFMLRCDVRWFDVMWCPVIWYDVMSGDSMWCDVMSGDLMWYDVMSGDLMWCDIRWYDVIWYDVMSGDLMWYDVMSNDVMWTNVMWTNVMWCVGVSGNIQLCVILMQLCFISRVLHLLTHTVKDTNAAYSVHSKRRSRIILDFLSPRAQLMHARKDQIQFVFKSLLSA